MQAIHPCGAHSGAEDLAGASDGGVEKARSIRRLGVGPAKGVGAVIAVRYHGRGFQSRTHGIGSCSGRKYLGKTRNAPGTIPAKEGRP
jgi:hypothetical protein